MRVSRLAALGWMIRAWPYSPFGYSRKNTVMRALLRAHDRETARIVAKARAHDRRL